MAAYCSRLMKLPPRMPKISMIAEPILPTCAGVRAKAVINMPQPVAPKTAARINTAIAERVTPFHLKENGACARIKIPTCATPMKKMPSTLPPRICARLCGRDQQTRQRPLRAFGKDGTSAVGDGVHQEHQCHAGRKISKQVELNRIGAFFICFERDGRCFRFDLHFGIDRRASFSALLRIEQSALHQLHDGGHAAGASLIHARDEFIHDGFDDTRARGAGWIGIHFDLYWFGLDVVRDRTLSLQRG